MNTSFGTYREKLNYIFSDQVPYYQYKTKTFYAFSDHLALYTKFKPLKNNSNLNSPWKLNNNILKDFILETKITSSLSLQFSDWDSFKFYIRNLLIIHKRKNNNSWKMLIKLSKDINRLTSTLSLFPNAEDIKTLISLKEDQSKKLAQKCLEY